MSHRVTRWNGAVAAAVLLAVSGVVVRSASLFVAAVVPLSYVAYGALSAVPAVTESVTVRRELEPTTVPPGEPVDVTVTVENTGERVLPDLRVVDRVPGPLRVLDGTPRAVGTLRPGERLTLEYRVLAKRGEFDFAPPLVRGRSLAASAVSTAAPDPAGEDRLVCRLDADSPPLDERASGYAGQLATDHPGQGVEFHSTREYDPGDPATRIDWRHYAKRGDLATVNFREHRAADVVLVVDAREPGRVVAGPGHPSAVELCAYAATRSLAELSRAGHEVGVAVVGVDGEPWLPPGGGRDHRARARALVGSAADAAAAADGSDERDEDGDCEPFAAVARRLADRVSPGTQVLLFSALLDEAPVSALDIWGADGLSRGVVTPNVLAENTLGGQLSGVRRHERLARCRATGARAVDWRRGTPLPLALDAALASGEGSPWS